ncbi:unnamed protein product [Tilletia controversa]|nr:unnamed protein product [Tilletia controversa]CAD6914971.1 unnamed protein product [Tilletia controversa]
MLFKRSKRSTADLKATSETPLPEISQTVASLRRPCGWYERLFVSTSHTGEPLYATYVGRIEKSHSEVHAATHKRVDELIERVAMLSAKVTDTRSRQPHFEVPDQRRTADDVIFTQSLISGSRDEIREEIHDRAVQHATDTFSLDEGRLWSVGLWTPVTAADGEQQQQNYTYLSMTILHLATDGLGGRFLFEALISPAMPEHITFLPGLPPTLEQTIGYKLEAKMMRQIAWVVFSYLFPKPIRHRMTWAPHWPLKVEKHPSTQQTARKIFLLEGSIVPKLKGIAKANGLGTVNPVLSIGALAALFSVTAPPDAVDSNKRLPFHLALETPIALREPEKLKHSSCAGNFSGAHLHQAQLRRTTPFWAHAREYSDSMKGTDTNQAVQFLALSKLIPDPANYKPTEEAPTPWDAYVRNEMKKAQPFRSSLDLVNLGAMHGPKNGRVSEISISGTIDQTYSAFMLACGGFISHDADIPSQMSVTLAWRRGCVPEDQVTGFVSNFKKMLSLIVAGRIGESTTFGQVAEMLEEVGLEEWCAPDFEAAKALAKRATPAENKAMADAVGVDADAVLAPAPGIASVNAAPIVMPSTATGIEVLREDESPSSGGSSRSASQADVSSLTSSSSSMFSLAAAGALVYDSNNGSKKVVLSEKAELDVGERQQAFVPVLSNVTPGY